jgi:hypothetical protein
MVYTAICSTRLGLVMALVSLSFLFVHPSPPKTSYSKYSRFPICIAGDIFRTVSFYLLVSVFIPFYTVASTNQSSFLRGLNRLRQSNASLRCLTLTALKISQVPRSDKPDRFYNVKKSYPCKRPWRPIGL